MYPSKYIKELNQMIIEQPNYSEIDIYNHWIIKYNIFFDDTNEILKTINFIKTLKNLPKEQILFLNNIE